MQSDFLKKITEQNEYFTFLQEFDKELETNSDRGVVLICGSIIDNLLMMILKDFLIESDKIDKDLFKGQGTLATFDAKVKISYYLGLINEIELKNITLMQRIRNKFAHQVMNISFENNDIANICSHFEIPKNGFSPSIIPFPNKETRELPKVDLNPIKHDTSSKDRFIFAFKYLFINLGPRMLINDIERRTVYSVVHTAEMNASLILKKVEEGLEAHLKQLDRINSLIKTNSELIEKAKEDEVDTKLLQLEESREEAIALYEKAEESYTDIKKVLDPMQELNKYILDVIKNSNVD